MAEYFGVRRVRRKHKKEADDSEVQEELGKALTAQKRSTKGRRAMGRQDMTDIPTGVARQVMPLPYFCPRCRMKYLNWVFKCNLCGTPTPLAKVNWRR